MIVNGQLKHAQYEIFTTATIPDHSGSYGGLIGRAIYDSDTKEVLVDDGTRWVRIEIIPDTVQITPVANAATLDGWESSTFNMIMDDDVTLSFTNMTHGQSIVMSVFNNDSAAHTITFPQAKWVAASPQGDIGIFRYNLYSIVNIAGTYYINAIKDMG
jgi:hypothetical protein